MFSRSINKRRWRSRSVDEQCGHQTRSASDPTPWSFFMNSDWPASPPRKGNQASTELLQHTHIRISAASGARASTVGDASSGGMGAIDVPSSARVSARSTIAVSLSLSSRDDLSRPTMTSRSMSFRCCCWASTCSLSPRKSTSRRSICVDSTATRYVRFRAARSGRGTRRRGPARVMPAWAPCDRNASAGRAASGRLPLAGLLPAFLRSSQKRRLSPRFAEATLRVRAIRRDARRRRPSSVERPARGRYRPAV